MNDVTTLKQSVNRWRRAVLLLSAFELVVGVLIVPPIITNTRPDLFYRNVLAVASSAPIRPRTDTDRDGLPDEVEIKLGTNSTQPDSDGDGLTDDMEILKYRTNPLKKDSDGDGRLDNDWAERREFSYSIQAIVDLRPPFRIADMNDFYQDARIIGQTGSDIKRVEIILYPEAKNMINPAIYPLKKSQSKFTHPTFTKNYDFTMKQTLTKFLRHAGTDLNAVREIIKLLNQYTYEDLENDLLYFGPLPFFRLHHDHRGNLVTNGEATSFTNWKEILQRQVFAAGMFQRKVHGDCGSTSIIRGALLRAAGIPERTIMTIPLFFSYTSDHTVIKVKNQNRNDAWLNMSPRRTWMADHFFNEALVGNRWIRIDNAIDQETGVSDKIKLLNFQDSTEYNLFIYGDEQNYHQRRPYRYISVIEQETKENINNPIVNRAFEY